MNLAEQMGRRGVATPSLYFLSLTYQVTPLVIYT